MAKKRNVKKDIEFITYEILNDCFLSIDAHPERKKDEITKLISDTIAKRNELIKRVNDRKIDKKETIKHFKAIYSDLMKSADEGFKTLSNIIKD